MSMHTWSIGLGVLLALGIAPLLSADGEAFGSERVLVAQAGNLKFEIYQDTAKEYRWRLKAANGAVLATSGQGYKAKADCQKGVERIKEQAGSDKVSFEVYEDKSKEYRRRLKAANGQIVGASSEGYKAKADCEKAIDLIKKGAAKAEVEEQK